jgi:DNA-binding response OmpR family regulator
MRHGLASASAHHPDVVLLDLGLPTWTASRSPAELVARIGVAARHAEQRGDRADLPAAPQRGMGARYLTHKQYLHVYVGHLRSKLEHDSAKSCLLLTEAGVGYRLKAD